MENIEERVSEIKRKIASYDLNDVYNMDETGLFYNLAPDTTIARCQIEGSKKDKTRLTIAFTVNATGNDRFIPLFIGHANKPRCFQKKSGEQLGFFYLSNTKAWMTGAFFRIYLQQFDTHVKRKVLLLIDNAPSHISEGLELSNVEIVALPPNTTSKLQPLDAGIISSFKRHYCRRQINHAITLLEVGKSPYKIDQLTAMRWSIAAWREIDVSVFRNCWRHSTLISDSISTVSIIEEQNITTVNEREMAEFTAEFTYLTNALRITNVMSIENFLNPAEEDCVHTILTDAEILEAAQTVEEEESDEEVEIAESLKPSFSKKDKLIAYGMVALMLEDESDCDEEEMRRVVQSLWRKQKVMRRSLAFAADLNAVQPKISEYFK